ncbi:hypothetical protein [Planomonospora algeriensis]
MGALPRSTSDRAIRRQRFMVLADPVVASGALPAWMFVLGALVPHRSDV